MQVMPDRSRDAASSFNCAAVKSAAAQPLGLALKQALHLQQYFG
jgi:hypothetical protein